MIDRTNTLLRKLPAWPLYVLGAGWAVWQFYLGATGGLGVEPIKALEHRYGELALQSLIVTLCVTPLRQHVGLNLLKFRRALGLLSFFFVVAHFAVWAVLDVQTLERVWADILKRPYITVGMAAFLLMIPLAITSNNLSLRRIGAATWRRLHKLTYVIAVLGAVHFVWLAKGFQIEPLIYLVVVLGLLALRIRPTRKKQAVRQRA